MSLSAYEKNIKSVRFRLEWTQKGLKSLRIVRGSKGKAVKEELPPAPVIKKIIADLERYLDGNEVDFSKVPIDDSQWSAFERKVLRKLAKVPWGKVITYRSLAVKAGIPRGARAVGSVMRKNRLPIILPCHRVIRSSGDFGQYAYGKNMKKRLLKLEERDS